jgi:hypothetical protein
MATPSRVGICIVRVERESERLLIRVQRVVDLERPREARWEPALDIDDALAMLRDFLEKALSSSEPGGHDGSAGRLQR